MKPEDAEEYTQALGQVVAGGWRQAALGERLGVPKALGLSTRDWVEQRLGGYVRLSIEQRREAVAELIEEGMKPNAVADVLGADVTTIRKDKRELSRSDETDTASPNGSTTEARGNHRERIEALAPDLADRVTNDGLSLAEAEHVTVERQKHVDAYIKKVDQALDLLVAMIGHPVPAELSRALTPEKRKVLRDFLKSNKGASSGRRAVA